MVDAMMYKLQFAHDADEINQRFRDIERGCVELKNDPQLKTVLAMVLNLGNLVNHEYASRRTTQAIGFRITALTKLKDVRARTGQTTLLHFLAETIADTLPDVSEMVAVDGRYAYLRHLRHIHIAEVEAHLHALEATLDRLRQHKSPSTTGSIQLAPFFDICLTTLRDLKERHDTMRGAWRDAVTYFGETETSMTPQELFMIFDGFFQSLNDALQIVNRQRARPQPSPRSERRPPVMFDTGPSLRDQLLNEIREKGGVVKSAVNETIGQHQECSLCGLPMSDCDCTF
jgi:hypothetical protein